MTADGFEPPSYYRPQRSPSGLLLILIAAALIFVVGGVLAFVMGLWPFAATPGASPTSQPTADQPPASSSGASAQRTQQATPGQSTDATPPAQVPTGSLPTIPPDAMSQLLFHIPEAIRATCTPATFTAQVIAAVNCLSGAEIGVTYSAYLDSAGMYSEYNSSVDRAQFDRDSGLCYDVNSDGSLTATLDKWPSEHPYTVGGNPAGRFFCIERGPPTITWTDDRLYILGLATATTGDANRLVNFWLNEAGPIP
jgi:hypothetical protein